MSSNMASSLLLDEQQPLDSVEAIAAEATSSDRYATHGSFRPSVRPSVRPSSSFPSSAWPTKPTF
jgi:hypothetical protein